MSKFVTLHGFGGSSGNLVLQDKTIIPTTEQQVVTADDGYDGLGIVTIDGYNGVELNFEIVGGTTQPTNPTENTIWVNTDTQISSYHFSVVAPFTMTIIENAGTVLGTIDGRTFSKTANGKAAFAMVYNGIHSGPMLVSPSIESCSYSTNDGYVGTANTPSSVEYNGTTYYYHGDYWFAGDNTSSFPYVVKGSSNEEIAKILAAFYENPIDIEGMVWIVTGTGSTTEFNALKESGIQVCPISTKQFVNGAWVEKLTETYQYGKWVSWWDGTLYYHGNEYVSVTGGWTGDGTKNSNNLYLTGYTHIVNFKTVKKIDLTNFTKLTAIGHVDSAFSNGISVQIGITPSDAGSRIASAEFGTAGAKTIELDLTNINGEYYIVFCAGLSSSCQGYVTEVRLS